MGTPSTNSSYWDSLCTEGIVNYYICNFCPRLEAIRGVGDIGPCVQQHNRSAGGAKQRGLDREAEVWFGRDGA